jgi:hypothetical protein
LDSIDIGYAVVLTLDVTLSDGSMVYLGRDVRMQVPPAAGMLIEGLPAEYIPSQVLEVRYDIEHHRVTLYLGHLDFAKDSPGDDRYGRGRLIEAPDAVFADWYVIDLEDEGGEL